jgi:hypothetical protein
MVPWFCCQLGAREHWAIPRARLLAGESKEVILFLGEYAR